MDPVTTLIELAFAAVFIGALVALFRGRDPLALDVILVFLGVVVVLVVQLLAVVLGPLPLALSAIAIGMLFSQPFFTLRLAGRIRSLPSWLLPASGIALIATLGPFIALALFAPTAPAGAPLAIAAITTFGVVEAIAAGYLALEARRRAGSARIRLSIAAIGTGAFAIAILAAGAVSAGKTAETADSGSGIVFQLLALVSSLLYVVAFLPPVRLRQVWQATASYGYTQAMLLAAPSEDAASLWSRLATATAEIAGSDVSLVFIDDSEGKANAVAIAGSKVDLVGSTAAVDFAALLSVAEEGRVQRISPGRLPAIDEIAKRVGARYKTVIALPAPGGHSAILVHLSAHPSLFGADDASLLAALGRVTSLLVERRSVLAEQELLTDRLKTTVEALESASKAKSDFLASMSHELRTPLNAVIGFSDLMRTEPRDGDSVTVPAEWVEHIHRSGQHLLGLINDVLDLSKVEAGRLDLTLERIDLAAAVIESVAGMRPLADRKRITVETTIPPLVVEADRGRLRQIVYNLLSNAIKYTPEGGRIEIDAARSGDEVSLSVSDNGVGIAPHDLEAVFEEFRQVGDPLARQPGTGLGLALTKRLVEAHGGRIELESTPGQGSRFIVILPAVDAPAEGATVAAPGPLARRHAGPPDVLVIEDEPSGVRLLRTYLESDGYQVRIASDGERGLEEARRAPPAAIILDLLLPGMDGWDVLRQLKSDSATRDIPVIIVTIVDEREIGLALGAVDYLVKPVERTALLDVVRRYSRAGGPPLRVLAIDDDPAALEMIDATLRPSGYDVVRAGGGVEGLELARTTSIDFVVCDILMPDLDGFGVVAELRADPRTHDLPILVLTNHELTHDEKMRLNGEILGVVAKGELGHDGLRDWLAKSIPTNGHPARTAE